MAISTAQIWQAARGRLDARLPVLVIAVAMVAFLVVVPLVMLLYGTFTSAAPGAIGAPTLDNFVQAYSNPKTYEILKNSLIYAIGVCLLSFFLGTSLAWLCERTNMPLKNLVFTLTLVKLIIPGVLGTIAWIFLLSPKIGLINLGIMNLLGISQSPLNIYSLGGMIWVESVHLAPLVFLLMGAAFRSMDPSLEDSATMSGSGTLSTLYRITLRLMMPAIVSVMLITFVRGVESFEVPALVGLPSRIFVFTAAIYSAFRKIPSDFGLAGALSVTILVISAVGVLLYSRMTARGERFSTVTGKGFRAKLIDLGSWKYPAVALVLLYFVITVVLPVLILLWSSLLRYYAAPSTEALSQVSFQNYVAVWNYPKVRTAFMNTALAATATTVVVMLLSSIISWIVVKTRTPGRQVLDNLAFLPIAFPGVTLGMALIWVYLTLPFPIYGTLIIMVIAYVTKFMPYGVRACSASLIQIHKELEEASYASGASWLQTFVRVTIPLLRPGLLAGGIYVAIVSLRELSSSVLLYSSGSEVLSILIFDMWEDAEHTLLSALGIIMIVALGILVFALQRLGGRIEARV